VSLPLVWSRRARYDLGRILSFIRARNPKGAETVNTLIRQSTERLPAFPYLHREGRAPGTREAVVHPNYLYVYRVGSEHIEILRVLHARQPYP
jgi:addiction module RelE/StbE family toxin